MLLFLGEGIREALGQWGEYDGVCPHQRRLFWRERVRFNPHQQGAPLSEIYLAAYYLSNTRNTTADIYVGPEKLTTTMHINKRGEYIISLM